MEYMLVFNETPAKLAERNDPTKAGPYWGAWSAYIGALKEAGIMTSGNGLQSPETGTTIRIRNGVRQVQDGPHPDTKEQLGGYVIINVPNLDAALEWAARSPSSTDASTEVRPVLPPMS